MHILTIIFQLVYAFRNFVTILTEKISTGSLVKSLQSTKDILGVPRNSRYHLKFFFVDFLFLPTKSKSKNQSNPDKDLSSACK